MLSKRTFKVLSNFILLLVLCTGQVAAAPNHSSNEWNSGPGESSISTGLSSSPVMFIENVGQFDPSSGSEQVSGARFQVRGGNSTIWLAEDALWVTVLEKAPAPDSSSDIAIETEFALPAGSKATNSNKLRKGVNIKLSFVGANLTPILEPFDRLDTHVSYFTGSDSAKWQADVPVWGGIRYKNLYPGIDLEITSENRQVILYLTTRAGADLDAVRLQVDGSDGMTLDGSHMLITTAVGEFSLPLLQISGNGNKRPSIPVIYGNQVTSPFGNLQEHTTSTTPQFSAPDLLISTFLGGSGDEQGYDIATDTTGASYITGYTHYSADFPTTPGAFDTSLNSIYDAFVVKLNATGSALTYATFLGGSSNDDVAGISVDADGAAYIVGHTESYNFPTTPGAFDTTFNGADPDNFRDAFIVKLDENGGTLDYATFLGGSGNYDYGNGIAVDASGAAYITGLTYSSDFPTTPGAFDTSYNGGENPYYAGDAFIVKLNANGSALDYATFLGGSSYDYGNGIAVDGDGLAYVTGYAKGDFPTTPGAFISYYSGFFIVKLNADGSALNYSSIIGGDDYEISSGIAVDSSGSTYVTGYTFSSDFPTTPGAFDTSFSGGVYDSFVVKLNPAGSALMYATFIGGIGDDQAYSIAVDTDGVAYVTGHTSSSNFPTTLGAFDTSYSGGDSFVAKLDATGSVLDYATFLGGSNYELGHGLDVDTSGAAYITGFTNSIDFPTTPEAFDTSLNDGDAFVVKLAMTGGPTSTFTGTIFPVYPADNSIESTVMQGGTAYRYFRLLDSDNTPIVNATITFTTGDFATSDVDGYFTAALSMNAPITPGAYPTGVQSITIGGQIYTTNNQPAFNVNVTDRHFYHAWSYGASTRAKGGISEGIIAYLQRTTSGGLELKIDETNPDITSDDVVFIKENFSDELGFGGGAGIEKKISVGILQIKGGASATLEQAFRSSGSTQADFYNPYSSEERTAGGVFLLASSIDSLNQAFPGKPFAVQFLKLALDRTAVYKDYISEQQAAFGSKITPLQADVGASAVMKINLDNSSYWKEKILGFNLVDAGVSVTQMNLLTDYCDQSEWGLGFESEHEVDWSLLSVQIVGFKDKVSGIVGDQAKKVKVELVFDSTTDTLKRLEISFTGEGNPYAYTDVFKEEVTLKMIIPADQLGNERLDRTVNIVRLLNAARSASNDPLLIGPSAIVNELNGLMDGLNYAEYEVTVDDGAEVQYEPTLGITAGIEIELGTGLAVKKVRGLVRERGFFINGIPYITETYEADTLVSRPGKSWQDLSTNALGGLWTLVADAFSWVAEQVSSGVDWVIETSAKTIDGITQGVAQIFAPAGTQLYLADSDLQSNGIQEITSVTVTAIGWVPSATTEAGALSLRPGMEAASGEGFVVGGIYEFQPQDLTLSQAATLVISYTDEALGTMDESCIGMFSWNSVENNWQPMAAISDLDNNTFTAAITQLGTFTLGCDPTPPQISILDPLPGSDITNNLPLITALLTDIGVGIDPVTVEIQLDGQSITASYNAATGELAYLPETSLTPGQHTIDLSAKDVVGNQTDVSAVFTVSSIADDAYKLFLPLVLR